MSERFVYLDHAATTPADPRVVAAMQPFWTEGFGNPSSVYRLGRSALEALDSARATVARILNCSPKEIVFTGGGSESDNLAIKGAAIARREEGRGNHIVTSTLEHHAVLHACEYLQSAGFEVTFLPVSHEGLVDLEQFRAALRPETVLATIMYANNEIGTIQPVAEIGAICRERGVLFHSDAVQAGGTLPLDVRALNVDLLTLTAHKFYGPKGTGLLYVRQGTPLVPQINGGGQERRRRAGTENVPGIVGFAEALRLAEEERPGYVEHCRALRERLIAGVETRIPFVQLNGDRTQRLANNANLAFEGVEAESVLLMLDQQGFCASSGSACTAGSMEPSHVLTAIGADMDRAMGSVRFTVGRATTTDDIDRLLDVLPPMVERLRSVSPRFREQATPVGR
ncbi:MAG TPA: cysteine desulfurase family protein [Herpetosiphonaceae bacterium]|nr:cysteine desulfurase family protein [Herpetosiphonaceae bacterium]